MRRYSFISFVFLVLLGALAAICAVQERWAASVALLSALILGAVLVILLSVRYLARLIRTESRKSRMVTERTSEESREEILVEQGRSIATSQEASRALTSIHVSLQAHLQQLDALKNRVTKSDRSHKSHVTSTARHISSEVEALLQIYARFPETKLPMPPLGGWAIDAQSLAYLISLVQDKRPRLILELGSGTSTIWLGYLCQSIGAKLVTLDHLEKYLEQTRAAVLRHGLEDVVESRFAPLEKITLGGSNFDWYSADSVSDLVEIDMILVDGPPAATGPQARYPALPLLNDQLSSAASIVLDDAHRPDEARILKDWQEQFPAFERIVIGTPRLAILEQQSNQGRV